MGVIRRSAALSTLLLLAGGCSQKDPAQDAIAAAEAALAAVYEDAQQYVPGGYAEVKAQLESARTAFSEERYADAIAAVQDVPARAGELAQAAHEAKEKHLAELRADWTRLSGSLPGVIARIEARLDELEAVRRLPQGMDRPLLDEAIAAFASAHAAWEEAGAAAAAGNLETAVAKGRNVEAMAQDLVARLGMQPG